MTWMDVCQNIGFRGAPCVFMHVNIRWRMQWKNIPLACVRIGQGNHSQPYRHIFPAFCVLEENSPIFRNAIMETQPGEVIEFYGVFFLSQSQCIGGIMKCVCGC